jgi:hypothetical protein
MAEAPFQFDARKEVDVTRDCRHGGAQHANIDPADLILANQRNKSKLNWLQRSPTRR